MFDQSCFAGDEIVAEEATLADGKKHALHFRPMSVAVRESYGQQMGSDDEKVVGFAKARLLAKLICTPDGKDAVDYLTLARLKTQVFDEVFDACMAPSGSRRSPMQSSPSGSSSTGSFPSTIVIGITGRQR